jgi:serine/threonine protein kinase
MEPPRWNIVTPSQYEWERRALDFIKAGLPDHDPYRAWSNFEFQTSDGAIYEVDLLVLTKLGFWLVENKAWGGRIYGDTGTWTRSVDGRLHSEDNPVLLANRKAKALSSLLKAQSAAKRDRLPWLDALIFLSADDLQCDLTGAARNRVLLKDRPADAHHPERKGILAALINREAPGIDPNCRDYIDIKVAKAIARAMEQAGIRPSQRSRRVGDYILGDLIVDGPGYQDRLAKHASFQEGNVCCRVRQYTVAHASTEEQRNHLKRAAAREFQIIQTLDHQGILPVLDYKEHENGPALLFRYLDPNAVRFDHYLASNGEKLSPGQRLEMLRQIADAIRYAHRKRVIHRSLGPQSILVTDAAAPMPRLQVFNWQVGIREAASTSGRVTNVEDLVEALALVYMSPESLSDSRKVTEASDVFSLGAIAFHLFAARPPASNPTELAKILRDQKGLSISAVVDGAGPKLEELIQWSTHPDVLTRIGSVEDFLTLLADVEDELTAPTETVVTDPLQAKRGDRLPNGFVVERILGQGATALALLVKKGDKESVLKVALKQEDNARLHEEAEALRSLPLHSEFIVDIEDELTMNGRTVLVLQKAGDRTLASMLAKEGVPGLDLLERYGENLLSAVCSLESHGVAHRDIKPDNIGIRSLTKQRNQLILFDFSLARAPLENITVGTEVYRDPFLKNRKPPRWDLAAERYSVGLTLYEMTLGSGVLPKWGDGKSDPALTDDELVIDAEKFDPSVRDGLVEFFEKALHREPEERFGTADEMRWAWQEVYKGAEKRKIKTPTGDEVDLSVSVEEAELRTPVISLGLSTRARNALERANVITVRDLLNFPIREIHLMRGVGNQTRQEIIRCVAALKERFPNNEEPAEEILGTPSLETLRNRILGTKAGKKETDWNIRCGLLGLGSGARPSPLLWPSQTDTADSMHVSPSRVYQTLAADRTRWSKDQLITAFRHELCEQIQKLGGIVAIPELIDLTLILRPAAATLDLDRRQMMASAVARAAVEAEDKMAQRRFELRRVAGKTVVSCSQELAAYADKLGQVADDLASADTLPPPLRVFQELYEVPQPQQPHGCQPFSNERMLNLAAAMSKTAAVSSRQELYPRGMPAERALRLGIGALSGLGIGETEKGFTVEQIRERVRSRYPEAELLPDRPELDALLAKVGLDVHWDAEKKRYQRREAAILSTSGSSVPKRHPTAKIARQQGIEITPEKAEARTFQERLKHAYADGGFLVLTVRPSRMRWAEDELLRRFDLKRVSFDDLLFDALREEAKELEVDWAIIEQADGTDPLSQDWKNLLQLAAQAGPRITETLAQQQEHLLLVHPGLIARYDLMAILEKLRDKVGHDVPCPGLWVLVATDGQSDMPVLDHAVIPLISPGQRAKVSEAWINNEDRGQVEAVAVPSIAGAKGGK